MAPAAASPTFELRLRTTERRVKAALPNLGACNAWVLLLLNCVNAARALPQMLYQPDYTFIAMITVCCLGMCAARLTAGCWAARAMRATLPGNRGNVVLVIVC